MEIKHLFFDLDRTLWDFDSNSHQELLQLFRSHQLHQKGISLPKEFIKVYKKINQECWEKYRNNLLSKERLRSERFQLTLEYFGIDDSELAKKIGKDYVNNSPYRTKLIPYSIELLNDLKEHYQLHIITNGFEEVQYIKVQQSGLSNYFKHIITSEAAGVKKPDPIIFHYAFKKTGANANDSIMIGDDLSTDIKGALAVGMKALYYNPYKRMHSIKIWKEVQNLKEIKKILL